MWTLYKIDAYRKFCENRGRNRTGVRDGEGLFPRDGGIGLSMSRMVLWVGIMCCSSFYLLSPSQHAQDVTEVLGRCWASGRWQSGMLGGGGERALEERDGLAQWRHWGRWGIWGCGTCGSVRVPHLTSLVLGPQALLGTGPVPTFLIHLIWILFVFQGPDKTSLPAWSCLSSCHAQLFLSS